MACVVRAHGESWQRIGLQSVSDPTGLPVHLQGVVGFCPSGRRCRMLKTFDLDQRSWVHLQPSHPWLNIARHMLALTKHCSDRPLSLISETLCGTSRPARSLCHNTHNTTLAMDIPVSTGWAEKAAQPQAIIVWSATCSRKGLFMSRNPLRLLCLLEDTAGISSCCFFPFCLVKNFVPFEAPWVAFTGRGYG